MHERAKSGLAKSRTVRGCTHKCAGTTGSGRTSHLVEHDHILQLVLLHVGLQQGVRDLHRLERVHLPRKMVSGRAAQWRRMRCRTAVLCCCLTQAMPAHVERESVRQAHARTRTHTRTGAHGSARIRTLPCAPTILASGSVTAPTWAPASTT